MSASGSVKSGGSATNQSSKTFEENSEAVSDEANKSTTDKLGARGGRGPSQLVYPKFILSFSMQVNRDMNVHIKAQTYTKGVYANIGGTETIKCNGGEEIVFTKTLNFIYHVGIDDRQKLILEVHDGDYLGVGAGFLFAKLELFASDLTESSIRIPLYMEDEDLQMSVTILTTIEDATEELTIQSKKRDLEMSFFQFKPPTLDDVREITPYFEETFGTYVVSLNASGLATPKSVDPALIGETAKLFIKFVTCESRQTPTRSDLREIWKSVPVSKKPFGMICPEIKIEHELLTGSRKLHLPIDDTVKVVVQIFFAGLEKHQALPPKLISYAIIPLQEFIGLSLKKGKKGNLGGTLRLRLLQHENMGKKEEPKANAKKKEKDKKEEEEEDPYDSFDEEIDEMNTLPVDLRGGEAGEDKAEEGDEIDQENVGEGDEEAEDGAGAGKSSKSVIRGKAAAPYGTIILKVIRETIKAHTNSGDDLYEEELLKLYKKKKKAWIKSNAYNFKRACVLQAELAQRSKRDLELAMNGWRLSQSFIVDLQHASMQTIRHFAEKGEEFVPTESPFAGSSVLDALKSVFETVVFFAKGAQVRAYAGGGATPPPEEHPCNGFSRSVAFPLCQELMLSVLDENEYTTALNGGWCATANSAFVDEIDAKLAQIDPDGDLFKCLEPVEDGAQWGGYDYIKETAFSDVMGLTKGFLEASTIYHTCIGRYSNPAADVGHACSRSGSLTSASIAPSGTGVSSSGGHSKKFKEQMERMITTQIKVANVGTLMTNDSTMDLFFSAIPRKLQKAAQYNVDLEALEVLLAQPREGMKEASVVFWILGQCPPVDIIKRAGKLFERHATDPDSRFVALVVVLAAELRLDLNEKAESSLQCMAEPFVPFIEAFDKGAQKAHAKLQSRSSGKQPEQKIKRKKRLANEGLAFSPFPNLIMLQWVNWSEVMSQSFVIENEARAAAVAKFRQIYGAHKSSKKGHLAPPETSDALPSIVTVKQVLQRYYKEEAADRVIGRSPDEEVEEEPARSEAGSMHSNRSAKAASAAESVRNAFSLFRSKKRTDSDATVSETASQKSAASETSSQHEARLARESALCIHGFGELTELMQRYSIERQAFFEESLRRCISEFVSSVEKFDAAAQEAPGAEEAGAGAGARRGGAVRARPEERTCTPCTIQ